MGRSAEVVIHFSALDRLDVGDVDWVRRPLDRLSKAERLVHLPDEQVGG